MKKLLAILLAAILAFGVCSAFAEAIDYDAIPDEMTSEDGKYPVAFVTDVGQLKDKSFNEGIYNGTKRFASENGMAYKYYQPANGSQATGDDRYDAMKAAVNGGAQVVVISGFMAGPEIEKASAEFPDVKWVWVDGSAFGKNTVGLAFREEQCGFFAGYACVKDGYTKLGFAGGGGGTNPACCRYGYGFVQGAEAAAEELGVQVEMNYSWLYGATFSASPELEAMLNSWYENGTEVIFPCGGPMYISAFSAAAANDAWALGVDSDYADISPVVLTSPLKGVGAATYDILNKWKDGKWDEVGGTSPVYGTADGAIALPTAEGSWRFKKFTVEEYEKMVQDVINGSLVIDDDYNNLKYEYPNMKINLVE
ncbi:MAG: BMP family ABC transporter substrate-binding protein [Clostridia bacterium]|nr:BMP family ABC transporter substrate-binding protein [Clostridia bacterium]